jgi:selenide, water dikinase
VWRLDDERALVLTVDYITPVVDDARTWGRIAAANAASDVYAMGGRPLLALNLVGWPVGELSNDLLVEVLEGAADIAREGGWLAVGGHTIDDPEPKFGQAVLGEVHPERVLTNAGAQPGDALVLTKPLGTGIVATAVKAGLAPRPTMQAAVETMTRLNADAARAALDSGATACTDVTGFGLLGHLRKLVEASRVSAEIDVAAVPVLVGARELAEAGHVPGGTKRNLEWAREVLDGETDRLTLPVLADAQTSGGLLYTTPTPAAGATVIGRITEGAGRIVLR